VIADRIKKVQDSHLLELIQDVTNDNGAARISARGNSAAISAGCGGRGWCQLRGPASAQVSGIAGQAKMTIPFSDHHSEQEDYLWGSRRRVPS